MFNIPNNVKPSLALGNDSNMQSQNISQNYTNQERYNNNNISPSTSNKGVSLVKGQKISLSKINPNLDEIDICLGWDVGDNSNYDLDSEAFLLGANEKVLGDSWFVFYNQPISPDGAVKHSGDNKTGQGSGDDEIIHIKLSQVNPQVEKIVFIVTINQAKEYGYNFGNIKNAFIRVVDKSSNREMVKFNLSEYYKEVISMMVGELYKKGGEWRFNPIGSGTGDDLEGLCRRYGVNLID